MGDLRLHWGRRLWPGTGSALPRLGIPAPVRAAASTLLLAAAMVVSLSACGGSTATEPSGGGTAETGSPVSTAAATAATVPANGVWKLIDTGWKDPGSRMHAITFADGDNGLAIGWMPTPTATSAVHVVATENGGAKWYGTTLAAHDGDVVGNAIDSPLPRKVWGVAGMGYIASSPDNGMSWVRQTETTVGQNLNSVSFADGENGWVAGWQMNPSMKPALYTAVMLHTGDGGASWEKQTLALPKGRAVKLWAVCFVDEENGWAVGAVSDSATGDPVGGQGIVCHTVDGGKSWKTHMMPGSVRLLVSVTSIDTSHCWAVDLAGTVVSTGDGGKSWGQTTTEKNGGMCYAIAFADGSNGWIGGQKTLLRTTAGGETWAAEDAAATGAGGLAATAPDAVAWGCLDGA